jgi:uncharacterized membrane protein YbhN (UPF0104 family)
MVSPARARRLRETRTPAGALDTPATVPGGLHAARDLSPPAAHPRVAARRLRSPRAWVAAAIVAAVVALGAVGAATLDLGGAAGALAGADPQMLAAAIALYALGQTISGAMWAVCQGAGGVRIPLPTTLGMHWIARGACELLPASLGEAVRVGVVRRHPAGAAVGGWRIVGGLGGYKAVDAAVTGLAVLTMAMIVPLPGPAAGLRWTAVGTVAILLALGAAWRLGAGRRIARAVPTRARAAARGLGDGAGVLADRAASRTAAALALLAIVARLLSLTALLLALGAPPQAAALAYCVIVLAGVIPGAPGGAGAREMVLIPALALAHGVPTTTALAFSLAVQATALATSLVLGAAALAWLGPRLVRGAPEPVAVSEAPAAA